MIFASVALLVDGDNISAAYAGQILRNVDDLGPLTVRRAYGNATGIMGWADAPSFRVMHAGHGKNGADMLLAIDAMELALARGFEAFVIVTSDGDFSHLAHRLREMGKHVLGMGEELKAPQHFRKACVKYVDLKRPATAAIDDGLPALDRDIMEVIRSMDSAGNGAPVAQFNAQMRRRHADFKISEQEQKTWAAYFSKRPELYRLSKIGTETRVSIALRNDAI